MITNALPDIPRLFTAVCEWLACLTYIVVVYRRVPLRRTIAVCAVGLAAMIGIQYLAGALPMWLWTGGMLMAVAGMYLIVWLGAGTGKREGLYITARAFVLAELVASLHWQLASFLGLNGMTVLPDPDGAAGLWSRWAPVALLVVTYALCFTLAWAVERGNFSADAPTSTTMQLAVGTVAITLVTFAMSNLSFVSTNTPFSGSVGQEVFYIRTLVDFCGFAILFAQQEQARRVEANAELASINAQLESQHQEYLASKENIESIGRLAHDLKHQIAALRAEVDPQHAAAGFEQLEQSVAQYSAQQHSGNPVLDVILTTKTRACADRGITLTAVADGSLLAGMSSMDIASLFGNALDNAIEATSKLADPQQRLIRLALYRQGRFTVIRIENYYDSELSKDTAGNLRTTKRDASRHGFGVKSIRHIAQQYGGEVTIRTEDHWFTLTVLIPR
ncbi:sensor histidine kinase [Bifidobacterium aerophilum]|uniref:GHKL domain-containing protein n=1 Tax=Bifidobacterium aerophilum TaxID=1798155 RepID=A0A6N9Z5N5_9BIFI|nr:sensor histidine kinase [Bifidobacterium aerophilum]NEG89433.1 GHKL domain-containing protein [Bifidobacterium aerophilum]